MKNTDSNVKAKTIYHLFEQLIMNSVFQWKDRLYERTINEGRIVECAKERNKWQKRYLELRQLENVNFIDSVLSQEILKEMSSKDYNDFLQFLSGVGINKSSYFTINIFITILIMLINNF